MNPSDLTPSSPSGDATPAVDTAANPLFPAHLRLTPEQLSRQPAFDRLPISTRKVEPLIQPERVATTSGNIHGFQNRNRHFGTA